MVIKRTVDAYEKLNLPVAEAYKVLRENLKFCTLDSDLKTLTITSVMPKDGKTTVSFNLAIATAQAKKKVLLVDADFRKPFTSKRVNPSHNIGLSEFVNSDKYDIGDIIGNTTMKNLSYVSCGKTLENPAEMVSSVRFNEFLQKVKKEFDIVILDTPPLSSVIDGVVVASQTDATILVVRSGGVSKDKLIRAKEQLKLANANLVGTVLNRISRHDYKKYFSYYKYYKKFEKAN